ncbi:hypothetical protein A3770_05p38100 [Chloropicon primus]|uniref:Uncharacterized protein n=11 Tax=Chloropicon primus TaxID=1764295 RepID=A0A5B8MPT3_9CHLO|nr:hypothetical protein A3770_05p38100 [Chloropicon primus]|eukprot:QDZ21292.1 hypothetical protein A3770_05p38100 [Chloropicon primus]
MAQDVLEGPEEMDTASLIVADIRKPVYVDEDGNFVEADKEKHSETFMPACSQVCAKLPGGATSSSTADCTEVCSYGRVFFSTPGGSSFTPKGVLPGTSEEQPKGLFDTANFGLTTINYLSSKWYTYIPPRGQMPDEDCVALGREPPCGYRPGDVNPYGLRIVSLKGGAQDIQTATMRHLPQAMEYDLLSQSILILTDRFPATNYPTTTGGKPVLTLLAINETTGERHENNLSDTEAGQSVLQFCSAMNAGCEFKPPVFASLPHDYDALAYQATAFDTLNQVFYCVLYNSESPETSKTLFAVKRQTDAASSFTRPGSGEFSVSIVFEQMQYYKWPERLQAISSLELSPKLVESDGAVSFQPVEKGSARGLYAVASVKESVGPCAPVSFGGRGLHCGAALSEEDVLEHNKVYTRTFSKTQLEWSADRPPRCECPNAVVQLNIAEEPSYDPETQLMKLGNFILDPSGEEFTILSYIDERAKEQSDTLPTPSTYPSEQLIPTLSAIQSHRPEDTGSLFFFDKETEGFNIIENEMALLYDPSVVVNQYDVKAKFPLDNFPFFMFNVLQDSKAAEGPLSDIYPLETISSRSYMTTVRTSLELGGLGGLRTGQYVCVEQPMTCETCKSDYRLELEEILGATITSDGDFYQAWQSLFSSGAYTKELFALDEKIRPSDPDTYSFSCPEPCDEYTCDQCLRLFNRPCALYIQAGVPFSADIYALNAFGRQQKYISDDNFTVTITGAGFDAENNPATMPEGDIKLGPVWREEGSGYPGGPLPEGQRPLAGSELFSPDNPLEAVWAYPNYHDFGSTTSLKAGETYDTLCDPDETFVNGKCSRYIVRPRNVQPGVYTVEFSLDKAGNYSIAATLKGLLTYEDETQTTVDLGTDIFNSPYLLTVLPGDTYSLYSSAEGGGLASGQVGVVGSFLLKARDRFGNNRILGGDVVDVFFKGADYVHGAVELLPEDNTYLTEPLGFVPYANVTDTGDGKYLVQYYLISRIREKPFYSIDVQLQKESIPSNEEDPTAPFVIEILQGETSAEKSFGLQSSQSETGLEYVIAGKPSVFTVQAADRFANLQALGGDPFQVTVTDVSLRSLTAGVGGVVSEGGDAESIGARRLQQLDDTFVFSDPTVEIDFDSSEGDLGRYKVEYSIFEVGVATVEVSLYGDNIGPGVPGTAGEFGSPFTLFVSAAETFPGNCILSGPGLEGIAAGDKGESGLGQYVELQLRDEFGNQKSGAVEDAYLRGNGANYPQLTFRYLLDCKDEVVDAKGEEICEGNLPNRDLEGVTFIEKPYIESGPILYDLRTDTVSVDVLTQPISDGRFRSFFTSTLAGVFEMEVLLRPVNLAGSAFTGNFEPIMGEDGGLGTASLNPYASPFTVVVTPSEPSIEYSEIFYYDVPLDKVGRECTAPDPQYDCRSAYDIMYSTLQGKTHEMIASESGLPALPTDFIKGTAGLVSYFGFQLRDKYGNMVKEVEDTSELQVQITGFDAILGQEFEVQVNSDYQGDGRWRMSYLASQTGQYTLKLMNATTSAELLKLEVNDDGAWEPTTEPFSLSVTPADTDPTFCTATGGGLRGGRTGDKPDTLSITVIARDQLGNKKSTDVGEVAIEEASRFKLYVTLCGAASTQACDSRTREGFPGGSLADISEFATTDIPGEYRVQYTPTISPDLIPAEGGYFLLEIEYNGISIGGDTDVLSNDDTTFLKLVPQATTVPERVFALVQKEYLGADPTRSILSTLNGMDYTAGLGQGVVGQAFSLQVQARTKENFDLVEGGMIKRLVVELYDKNDKLVVQASNTWPESQPADTPELVIDQADGTFLVEIPAIPETAAPADVEAGAYDNRVTVADTYYLEIRGAKAGFVDIVEEHLLGFSNKTANPIVFRPGSTKLESVDIFNPSTMTRVVGDLEAPFEIEAGQLIKFFLQSRDRFGNNVRWSAYIGGDNFLGQMIRPSGGANADVPAFVHDNQNGTYLVEFTQVIRGAYKIYLRLDSVALPGSDGLFPFPSPTLAPDQLDNLQLAYHLPMTVLPAPRHVPSCTATTGSGIPLDGLELKVSEEAEIRIIERDRFGNLRDFVSLDLQGSPISFALNFTYSTKGNARQLAQKNFIVNEGEYELAAKDAFHSIPYVAGGSNFLSGEYLVYVFSRYDETGITHSVVSIAGSPSMITVLPGALSLETTIAYGPGIVYDNLNPGTTRAGVPATISLQTRDIYGNDLLSGGEEFLIIVKPLGTGIFSESKFESSATGFYQGEYTSKSSGNMLIQITSQSQLLPTTQFLYEDPVTRILEPRVGSPGAYQDGLERGTVVDSMEDPVSGEIIGTDPGVIVNILPGPLSPSKSYAQDGETSEESVILGGDKYGKINIDGSILEMEVVPVDIFGQKKTDNDDDQRLEARIVYVMNINNETTGIFPYSDETFADRWELDEDGRWISKIALVRKEGLVQFVPSNQDGEGMVPILVAGYYQFEVDVVKFDVADPSLVLERTPIGLEGVAPVSPYKFFANPGQSSGSETSLSFGEEEDATSSRRRRLLQSSSYPATSAFLESAGVDPAEAETYKPDTSYDFSVLAGTERSLSVGLSDAFGNAQLFDELRRLDSLVVRLGETFMNGSSPCFWVEPQFEAGQHDIDNVESNHGCTLLHRGWYQGPGSDVTTSPTPVGPDYSPVGTNGKFLGLQMSAVNNVDTGSFTIRFTPDVQLPAIAYGAYQMDIILNGQHIGASPYRFRVLPGPIFGPRCELFGLKPSYEVNKTIEVGIIARDAFGNNQTSSGKEDFFVVEASVTKKNVFGVPVLVRGCTQNTGAASSSCSFSIAVSGVENMGLYVISMLTTTASEYSLDGAEDHMLEVKFCPNPSLCSDTLNVYNPAGVHATGVYEPYGLRIEPGPTDAASTIAYGTALIEGGVLGQSANFTIEARDIFGNRRFKGGDNFQILIYQPPPQGQLDVDSLQDLDNGRYRVSFSPGVAGSYSIVILFGINSVANSPYRPIFVSNENLVKVSQTRVVNQYGSLLVILPPAVAAEDYELDIQAYSRDSHYSFSYPKTSGGEVFAATLTPPSSNGIPSVKSNVTVLPDEERPGRYTARISGAMIQKSGTYGLAVKACTNGGNATSVSSAMPSVEDLQMVGNTGNNTSVCGQGHVLKHILHSPFMVFVHSGVPDPANSFAVEFANPDALINHGYGWTVGEVLSFTVQIRDRFKNNYDINPASGNVLSLVALKISISRLYDEDAAEFPEVFVEDTNQLGNDEFYVQYTGSSGRFIVFLKTESAGDYHFDVALRGTRIKNGLVDIPIKPAAFDITNSYIESPVRTISVGQSYAFFIRARDVYGNPLISGGDNFLIDLTSSNPILDPGIGENPLNAIGEAQLPQAGIPSLSKEGKYTYSDDFVVGAKVSIADLNDGSYRVLIRSDRAGTVLLTISMYGESEGLPGICGTADAKALCDANALVTSPAFGIISVDVPAGNPSAAESFAENSFGALQQANAGELTRFRLNARDKFRNDQTLPGFNFEVRLKSSDGMSDVIGNVYYSTTASPLGPAGIYIGQYTPILAGNYDLSIRRAGKELKGRIAGTIRRGPFSPFTVLPGSTAGSTTIAVHEYLENNSTFLGFSNQNFVAMAGATTTFSIVTKDRYANPKTVGGEEFVINVGPLAQGLSLDLGNGTYSASYRMTSSGDYKLAILVNNQLVQNPPAFFDASEGGFKLVVMASSTLASRSEIVGVGLTTATAGSTSAFSIQTYDEFGNKKDYGGDTMIAELYSSDTDVVYPINVTDNRDGTYDFGYRLDHAGIFSLSIALESQEGTREVFYSSLSLPEDNPPPVVQIEPGTLSLAETTVKVDESLTYVFDVQTFEILPRDDFGNLITKVGTSDFSVVVSTGLAPNGNLFQFIRTESNPSISEIEGGFQSSVDVNTPGSYVVNVKYGSTLLGRPYVFQVIPAQYEGEIFNPLLQGASDREGRANPEYRVSIRVRDVYGNDLSDSMKSVDNVEGLEGSESCGEYSSEHCPFRVTVTRPDGLRMSSLAGWNNDMINKDDSVGVEVNDSTGIFEAFWAFIRSGNHFVSVSFHSSHDENFPETSDSRGAMVNPTPLDVKVIDLDMVEFGPAKASNTIVTGLGLFGSLAGEPGELNILAARDACILNNAVVAREICLDSDLASEESVLMRKGGAHFNVSIVPVPIAGENTTMDDAGFSFDLEDFEDGSYLLEYKIERAGEYLFNVSMLNPGTNLYDNLYAFAMGGARLITILPGETDAAMSLIKGLPLAGASVAGRRVKFEFTAKDRFGNLQRAKSFELTEDSFEVVVEPILTSEEDIYLPADQALLEKSISIEPTSESSYSASFQPRKAFVYQVSVRLRGKDLGNSPVMQEVIPSGIGSQFNVLTGLSGQTPQEAINAASAKENFTLVLNAFDEFNNKIRIGGDSSKFFMEYVFLKKDIVVETNLVEIADQDDGSYLLHFVPSFTGTYAIRLVVNGVPAVALGESYTAQGDIKSVAAYALQCEPEGPAFKSGTAAEVGSFKLIVRDRDGQIKTVGGDIVYASLVPRSAVNEYDAKLTSASLQVIDESTLPESDPDAVDGPVPGRYRISYNVQNFGEYDISVKINGEDVRGSPSVLQVGKRLPPVQDTAIFSSTATKLTLNFQDSSGIPTRTNRGDLFGLDTCDKLFVASTLTKLGDNARCTFVNPSRMEVLLGFGASILPNEELVFRSDEEANKIVTFERNSLPVSGSVIVERPVVSPLPTIVTRGPTKLSFCEDFHLDASGSYGAAGRALKYSYGILPNVPNDTTISGLLEELSRNSAPRLSLSKDYFAPGVEYTFTISVTNFLLETRTVRHKVTRMPYAIPQILIEGDPVLRTERNKPLYIRANVSVPVGSSDPRCNIDLPKVDFTWGFDNRTVDVQGFPLDPVTRETKTLYIAPGTLVAGKKYNLKVDGEVNGNGTLSNFAYASVEVQYSPIVLAVSMPSKITDDMPFVIDASESLDYDDPSPENPQDPFGPFMFYWSCQKLSPAGELLPEPCFTGSKQAILSQDPLERVLNIPEGLLEEGTYSFAVTASKEPLYAGGAEISGRVKQFQKTVTVTKSASEEVKRRVRRRLMEEEAEGVDDESLKPPQVRIKPVTGIVNANERFALESVVTSSLNGGQFNQSEISIKWEELNGIIDLETSYPDLLGTPHTYKNLVLKKNSLSPGQEYNFQISAFWTKMPELGTTFDVVSLVANGAPSSGLFEVSPVIGHSTSTRFTLKCSGWEDDSDEPVEYEFRYIDPNTNEAIPLVSRSRNNEVTSIMPPLGLGQEEQTIDVTLQAYIVDYYNAKTVTNFTIALMQRTATEVDPIEMHHEQSDCPVMEFLRENDKSGDSANSTGTSSASDSGSNANSTYSSSTEGTTSAASRRGRSLAQNAQNSTTTQSTSGTSSTDDSEVDPPECRYNITGFSASLYRLVENDLALARGTNDVAQLLVIAASVGQLAGEVKAEHEQRPVVPDGFDPPEDLQIILNQDGINSYSNLEQLKVVVEALKDAVTTEKFTKESMDSFGNTYRQVLAHVGEDTDAGSSVLQILDQAGGTGVDSVAASSLLDSMSMLANSYEQSAQTLQNMIRDELLGSGYNSSGANDTSSDGGDGFRRRRLLQQQLVTDQATEVMDMVDKLASAGVKDAVDGEDAFEVSSPNIQVMSAKREDPTGSFNLPKEPGAKDSPSFDVPTGLGSGSGNVEIVSSANKKNPFQGSIASGGKFASAISSSVASFDLKANSSKMNVSIDASSGQQPITIKIPVPKPESSCRKVESKCRYWDEHKQEWSTEGLFELERTDEYLVCQTLHLSSFAVSTDDVVPEFNVVDPFDLDLFSQMTLDNALAMFIVGAIYMLFALVNYLGYRVDNQNRRRMQVEQKLLELDQGIKGLSLTKGGQGISAPWPSKMGSNNKKSALTKEEEESLRSYISKKLLKDSELVAVINVKPGDKYTRPQRLMVLLSIVLGYFATSAIFFGLDPSNIAAKLFIGIFTAMILGPAKTSFKLLFRKSTYYAPRKRPARKKHMQSHKAKALSRSDLCTYQIKVLTSNVPFAGTHKNVHVVLYGDKGRSVTHTLDEGSLIFSEGGKSSKVLFERGEQSVFEIKTQDVGKLDHIDIGHDGKGWGSGWHLNYVVVINKSTGVGAKFPCGLWLDKKLDGGYCERTLNATDPFEDLAILKDAGDSKDKLSPGSPADGSQRSASPPGVPKPVGVPRPRRRRMHGADSPSLGSRASTASNSAQGQSFGGIVPPPPPLAAGQRVRPRRIRTSTASMMAVRAAAAFRGSTLGSRISPMPSTPGLQMRDEFGAPVSQTMGTMGSSTATAIPPPPPENLNAKRRPRRTKARQTVLDVIGMNRVVSALSPGGSDGSVPPPVPPPKASGAPRPRRRAGKNSVHPSPQTPVQRPAQEAQSFSVENVASAHSATKNPRPRPAVQATHRIKNKVLGSIVPSASEGASSEGASGEAPAFYVPPAIDAVVRKIQRRWKKKLLAFKRKQNKAATKIQAHWRAFSLRKKKKEEKAAQKADEIMSGLWWVKAHTQGKVISDGKKDLGFDQLAKKWTSAEQSIISESFQGKMDKKAEGKRTKKVKRRKEPKGGLPRWFIYVTYTACFIFCAIASWFTILYGLKFEPAIGRAWLLSSTFAIFVEMFVQDPIKIAVKVTVLRKLKQALKPSPKRRNK